MGVKIKQNYLGHIINSISHLSLNDNFDNLLDKERQKIVNKYYFIRDTPKVSIGTYSQNKLGMLINIKPEFNNFFSGLFGASKSETNKWNLNGEIDARFENIWGAMESIDFKWKNIDSTNQYFNLKLERPHFLKTGFESNLPIHLALINIWNINYLSKHGNIIVPYLLRS